MSSRAEQGSPTDVGLLSPVSAGTTAEALTGDAALVAAMVSTEAALVRALVETGIAPASASSVAERIEEVDLDARELALAAVEGANPVISLVERLRVAVGGDDAQWVHHGATSQDILDTALMLIASATVRQLEGDLTRLGTTLAALCRETRDLPVVGRTLTQQALPTTFGFRVSGWLAGVHDAVRVARTCTTLPVSLGGPVGTAASYGQRGPAVLDAFAELLGQRPAVSSWHTRRTPVVGLGSALTITGASCGTIAADVLVLSRTEVGEVREATGGPSSAMPHKANPARSVLVASAARQLPALGSVLAASAAAEDERPAGAWHAEWQPLRTMLRLAGGAAEHTADLAAGLVLDRDAMTRNLGRLVAAVAHDESWVHDHTAHTGVWVDRVLAQHEEVLA